MGAIYLALKDLIIKQIAEGIYKAGDQIPSERDLAETHLVSRMTARQAVNGLLQEGIVYRDKGRGTFVSTLQFAQKNVRSFTETLEDQGYLPSTKIIEFSKVHSLKEISQLMGEPIETQYFKIKRLRLGNELPIALETVYIPEERCKDLKEIDIGQSLYELLRTRYGFIVGRVSSDIDACISNRLMMDLFQTTKPVALLKMKGISYTIENEKLFYEESYYRSDLYKYQVDIYKR